MNEADRDIGRCDACGDDELPRARVKWHGVWAWLCSECRTTQALLDAFNGVRPDPHDHANDEALAERYERA